MLSAGGVSCFANQGEISHSVDFGVIGVAEKAEHFFSVPNDSDEDFIVHSVTTSCGCMKATMDREVIKPGEKGKLKIELDTVNFRGTKNVSITLRLKQPIREIQFTAKAVIRNVVPSPTSIQFCGAQPNLKQKVTLTRRGDPNWKITKWSASNRRIRLKTLRRDVEGENVKYTLECSLDGSEELKGQQYVVIHTTDKAEPITEIPVRFLPQPEIQFSLSRLEFAATGSQPVTRKVILKTAEASEIVKLKIDHPGFAVRAVKSGKQKAHVLEVTYTPNQVDAREAKLEAMTSPGNRKASLLLLLKSKMDR